MNWSWNISKPIYRVNSNGITKPLPRLETKNNSIENRTAIFLKIYWHNYNQWKTNSLNIKTEVLVCIAWADSHLWYALKWENNVGNVWNNDRWNIVHYKTLDDWIRAIARVLNWTYLKNKQTIGDLSLAWDCKIDCKYIYASDKEARQNNTLNCLSLIYNKQINSDFIFRK